jgi:pSer/pThr/pTyr-binding forkhead associated (FHA) protein
MSPPSARPGAPPRPQAHEADPAASANNLPRPRAHNPAEAMAPAAGGGHPHGQTGRGYDEAAASAAAQPYGGAPPVHAWASPQSSTLIRLVLVGRDGREGEAFPVPQGGVEIGRQGPISFPSDPFVSPQHAKVTPIEGGVHLADLGSRNGVYLRLTEPTPVYPGDYFLLGNQLLRLDRLEDGWQEKPLDANEVRGFGTPVKPPWAALTRVCVGEIDDDRYHLRGTEMTIGREQGEIVYPSDGFLSRAHARVRMQVQDNAMTVLLEDLGSANGTYLRVRGAANVPYNAMFRVGDQIFRVRHD